MGPTLEECADAGEAAEGRGEGETGEDAGGGEDDRVLGEQVAATFFREGEGSDRLAAELREHCKRTTAPYKFPRQVEFAAELPKTASGKIQKFQLRALLQEEGAPAPSVPAPAPPTEGAPVR